MAKEPTKTATDDEWETVETGIGEGWDFDKDGALVGNIIGKKAVELPERSWGKNPDGTVRKTADVWLFALEGTGEEVFVWDSYQLSEALTDLGYGDRVRISFDGYRSFTSSDGPRQVKKYKVQKAKSK